MMNWTIIVKTFLAIFLAELGDKTQLATFNFAAETQDARSVFIGAALALCLNSLIGVLVGKYLGSSLPLSLIKWVSGLFFIIIGIWTIIK